MDAEIKLPEGFKYAGVSCGIKESGKKDLALITSDVPAVAGGVYTQNVVRAASIDWNRQITPTDHLVAIAINSGNANACTGETGFRNNQQIAASVARQLDCTSGQVCVMSTGVIGKQLPMDCLEKGIQQSGNRLGGQLSDFADASEAILTTDKGTKTASCTLELEDGSIQITGMAKGAGMIGPNMATMLGIVVTDASLTPTVAQDVLKRAADASFNCISVEGHTSTNDSLVLMANGKSKVSLKHWKALEQFTECLKELCVELATQIPADGEGASHLISIKVSGAQTDADADQIARAVAMSNLVKTAVAGADPNWGRITSAAGLTEVSFKPEDLCLAINGTTIFDRGSPVEFDESGLSLSMNENFETSLEIRVGGGAGEARHWTSDLNEAYVQFNSLYTT